MEFFKKVPTIDFMGLRGITAFFSVVLFIGSLTSLFVNGLNLGLDFTGGTQLEVTYTQPANLNKMRQQLQKAGFTRSVVQSYGSSTDVLITIPPHKGVKQDKLVQEALAALPGATAQRNDYVGPQVGKELTRKGILAVVVSMIFTMLYILLRFEYRFAVSSTVALIHDPILILGIFSFFHFEFNLIVLGALLAIMGYSLNDTVVVFDRVRENFRKIRKSTPKEVMNRSINETLSRTTMTSGLTLLVVVALYVFGGETLKGFSLALIIGIVIGTYSSIYVAGSFAVAMGLNRNDFLIKKPKEIDDRP